MFAALQSIATGPELPSTYLEAAAKIALAPVGGLWRDGELFVVGWGDPAARDSEAEAWISDHLDALVGVSDPPHELV